MCMQPAFSSGSASSVRAMNVRRQNRYRCRLSVLLAAATVVSCGGGGDDACTATAGVFPMSYEPGVSIPGYTRLFYRAGSDQEWKLVFHGTSEACARALQVSAMTALPAGYSIDRTTGVIRRAASSTAQTGFCLEGTHVFSEWDEGVCPPGTTAQVNGYNLKVESDGFRNDTPPYVTVSVSFQPGS